MQTLILDTSWRPVAVKSWQEAMTDLFNGRIRILANYEDRSIKTVRVEVPRPAVAVYTDGKFSHSHKVRFSRDNIWLRDGRKCQYCGTVLGRKEFNLDHVVPKSLGGKTNWENIVCSCIPCNSRKANKTLEQSGMRLLSTPKKPTFLPRGVTFVREKGIPNEWKQFIRDFQYWNGELDHEE